MLIEELEKPKAKERQLAGKSADGKSGGRGKKKNPGTSCPRVSRDESARSATKAAEAVGLKPATYRKVKTVARQDPPWPRMDPPQADRPIPGAQGPPGRDRSLARLLACPVATRAVVSYNVIHGGRGR